VPGAPPHHHSIFQPLWAFFAQQNVLNTTTTAVTALKIITTASHSHKKSSRSCSCRYHQQFVTVDCSKVCLFDWCLTQQGYCAIEEWMTECVKTVVTGWSWCGSTTKTVRKKTKNIMKKNQNCFLLKVNGSWSNWSLWRLTPRHRHRFDTVQLANYMAK